MRNNVAQIASQLGNLKVRWGLCKFEPAKHYPEFIDVNTTAFNLAGVSKKNYRKALGVRYNNDIRGITLVGSASQA